MFGKTVVVLALAASLGAIGVPPSLAGSKSSFPGWYDANASAAQSRANLIENVLSPSAVTKVKYLRSVVAPVVSPTVRGCRVERIVAPLPAGGYLYAVTSGDISKYNPATGSLIWRDASPANLPDGFFGSLAISGNILIAGAYRCNHHGNFPSIVAAYNATTGKQLWLNSDFEGLIQPTAVAVAGSYVITSEANRGGTFVDVLNLSNGKPVWTDDLCLGSDSPVLPLVVGLLVITPSGCDGIEAQKLSTGQVVWSLSGGWAFQSGDLSGPAGTHLYATDPSGTVVDLNLLTGQVEYSLNQAVTVLAVDTSRVYATCGSSGQFLCAYNISTGAVEWQDTQLSASPALAAEADGVLYLGTGVAVNAASGQVIKTLWSARNGNPPATAIAVGDGRIAVVTDSRVLDLYGLKGY